MLCFLRLAAQQDETRTGGSDAEVECKVASNRAKSFKVVQAVFCLFFLFSRIQRFLLYFNNKVYLWQFAVLCLMDVTKNVSYLSSVYKKEKTRESNEFVSSCQGHTDEIENYLSFFSI